MFFNKKKKIQPDTRFQSDRYTPVLRCSICTGEQAVGFRDQTTGEFHEVMLIRDDRDLEEFKFTYGVTEIKKEY